MSKPREFWIEFEGNPDFDRKGYMRFVAGIEIKARFPGDEVIHVREILPNEPDYKAAYGLLLDAVKEMCAHRTTYECCECGNSIANKALARAKEIVGKGK